MTRLRTYFLGPFRVTRDDQSAIAFRSDKMRALLAYLLIKSGRSHRREALAALLWPDQPDIVALQNLRQALYILRRTVGEILLVTRQTAEFNPANKPVHQLSPIQALSPSDIDIRKVPTSSASSVENGDVWCDVWLFSELLTACKAHRQRQVGHPDRCAACIHRLQQATQLYRGDFLQGFVVNDSREFEEWMLLERETLHRQMMDALEQLADYYEEVGEHEQSLNYALWQLKLEPWREESHRQAMRLLSRAGQRSAALAQYETARQVLFEELGVEPARETTALYERIRDAETEQPGPEGTPRPLPVLGKRLLPIASTPLIGREAEMTGVVERLLRDEVRVLTVTGPGGVGKTRIAMQAAADLQEHFADGAYFVNLAPITDPGLVPTEIASALGVKETPDVAVMEGIVYYLQGKQALLFLDNFEQVAEAAPLISQLIQSAPGVKVLVTSRMALGLRGTQEYPISPMSLPPPIMDGHPVRLPALQRVAGYEGIRLFVARAAAIKPGFEVTPENAPAIVEICHRLDGLPLAIELAAARIKVLSPQAMLARLQLATPWVPRQSRLQLVASRDRDVPTRQQTLRNTIEWSYNLLDHGEKQLFRSIAVFQGGCTLDALEAVCASLFLPSGVLEGLESLVSKNLMVQQEASSGESRFWMLETIHEYAREKLAEADEGKGEEAEGLRREHALYFMTLAEDAEPHLKEKEQQGWLEKMEDEYDNLRTALVWCVEQGQLGNQEGAEIGLRTAGALSRFWQVSSLLTEGREQLERALSVPEEVLIKCSPGSRAKAMTGAGFLAVKQGDYSAARSLSEGSLVLGREAGDKQNMSRSLNNLAGVAFEQGDYSRARALYEETLELRREVGDKWGISTSLNNLGVVAYELGDYIRSRTLHKESVALFREIGDKWGISLSLNNLGNAVYELGDYTRARILYEESLALRREVGDKGGMILSLNSLGFVASSQGDYTRAGALHEESLALAEEIGDKKGVIAGLVGLGGVAVGMGQAERGAKLLGAVQGLVENMDGVLQRDERLPYERAMAAAHAVLGEEAFEKAWQEGRAMSMEQVIEYALERV